MLLKIVVIEVKVSIEVKNQNIDICFQVDTKIISVLLVEVKNEAVPFAQLLAYVRDQYFVCSKTTTTMQSVESEEVSRFKY